jgi:hypothetical protein
MTTFKENIKKTVGVDLFRDAKKEEQFVGRPFYIDYGRAYLLVADSWKNKVGGLPQGTFLLAFYENTEGISEAILLRALGPTKLPTDSDVISSMIEYYKDNLKTAGEKSQLDQFTRYQFSFSGLECRVLGTFYQDANGSVVFGADLENFYSSHHYSVYKPTSNVLEAIVNYKEKDEIPGQENDVKIGHVRYSSSLRFQQSHDMVPTYITSKDFLGKRTALFGMTRTGKSNTIKKIVQASYDLGSKGKNLDDAIDASDLGAFSPFGEGGVPKYGVGQIIFDINGEYANANLQDEGTAIFEMYKKDTIRYSVIEKPDFEVLKVNFYTEIETALALTAERLRTGNEKADYVNNFLAVSLEAPEPEEADRSARVRFARKVAAYQCCLYRAGFKPPEGLKKIKFEGNAALNSLAREENPIDPSKGITLQEATDWFASVWGHYEDNPYIVDYRKEHGHEWADEDLKALLVFLTRTKTPGGNPNVSGYIKLKPLLPLHTDKSDEPFDEVIIERLREGKIVIIDLSQGDPDVQRLYSERICRKIFMDAMDRFVRTKPNNFIQFYFEEAHNLFPKKDDQDLSQIYNRIAKEGAKLNLGLVYATQEVSSISSSILKNTQNWFIAHLNNEDELKELRKYYDFADFAEGLTRFSANTDKGFVRMKTYSNPFVVPVQIDQFKVKKN